MKTTSKTLFLASLAFFYIISVQANETLLNALNSYEHALSLEKIQMGKTAQSELQMTLEKLNKLDTFELSDYQIEIYKELKNNIEKELEKSHKTLNHCEYLAHSSQNKLEKMNIEKRENLKNWHSIKFIISELNKNKNCKNLLPVWALIDTITNKIYF